MKTIEEMIAVMQAFADGNNIEVYGDKNSEWIECVAPVWDWLNYDYRIKTEPKYRPYKNAEECFRDVQKHNGWILDNDGNFLKVLTIKDDKILTAEDINRVVKWPFGLLEDEAVWADDGTPCGVLEEE